MATFVKDGQRKQVADHLTNRIGVLLTQGWQMEGEAPELEAPPVTLLPDDFPGRIYLMEAGLGTVEAVREYAVTHALESIKGVGPVTAKEINAAL